MTPFELYQRAPEDIDYETNRLRGVYFNHTPEIDWDSVDYHKEATQSTIEFRMYKDFDFDGRRIWALGAVCFKGEFVMIIRNAGREGDDFKDRFVTNVNAYKEMVKWIAENLYHVNFQEIEDVRDEHEDIENLTKFYGNELDGYFERY